MNGNERMNRTDGHKRKTFVVLVILAGCLLMGALFLFTVQNGDRITNENREYLVDNAAQTANSIDNALSEGYGNIKILSELVGNSLRSPEFDITTIQHLIKNSVFDFMEFADAYGMDHNITGGVSDARDREYYLDAKAGNTGMELIYVSRATHETLLMFYSPIYYNKQFVGSLVGVYQASNRITKLLSTEYFGEKATSYLATEEGRIIASNQGFDPQQEMYIKDLAEGDRILEMNLEKAMEDPKTSTFSLPGNETGGCMVHLPVNGGYLVQIFPPEASKRMIGDANRLGYMLVGFILVVFVIILLALIRFYRRQQETVEEARNQAEIANRAKTSFLFNMSHDIRTPMNAILGYTNIGLRHIDNMETSKDCLTKIQTAGGHLLSLINDILEMSRIESGNVELAENPMDIREAIEGVRHMSQALAIPKSIDFRVNIGEIKDPYIYSDELHMNQVLINLISNAVKYTDEGGKITYSVDQISEVEDGRAMYRLTVDDTGIGMSEEFQTRLFETFAREKSSTVSKIEGAGLGLSIVKKIVDLAGGEVHVKSSPGKGSTFTLEIPFRVLDDDAIAEFKRSRESLKTVHDNADLKGRRVLLVEDNDMNRDIAEEILTEAGLEIETAEDGAVAVNIVREKGAGYYDFILMDIQMPVMDGYQATAEIRRLPDGGSVPIIALSANAFEEDKQKSLEAGMNAHVAKPIDINALLEAMTELL